MADGVLLKDVRFGYAHDEDVLRGVTAAAPAGAFVAVIGPNGCGKSTLMKILAGLLRPRTGEALTAGAAPYAMRPRDRARLIGYLPQSEPHDVPFTVRELVLMSRYALQGAWPFDRGEDEAAAMRALAAVDAAALAERLPGRLSGGERQRAFLARALANDPSVLLLDEPAGGLDARHQVDAYRLVRRLNRERGCTVLTVSHDLNLPGAFADLVWVVNHGVVVEAGPPAAVLRASVLEPVYGVRFLEARAVGVDRPLLLPRPD